ncbi:hypothetical protein OG426_47885 [Streptomyces canus]|uniref:hypothetical protein n=1 Tax=Streptomyces canus TaxID=58343 RepID=UPI003863E2C6|nr:hypothetical protein OG426_47885 [Streptomyces canus]
MKVKLARKRLAAAATTLAAGAALLLNATPAQAATTFSVSDNCDVPWINCSEGDLHLNYNSMQYATDSSGKLLTSYASFYGDVYDYAGTSQYQGSTLYTYEYVFGNGGNGNGQQVKNNAASVWNCAPADNYYVYYNSGYLGHSQYFRHAYAYDCYWADLDSTLKNENASEHFA